MGNRYSCDQEVELPDGRKLIVVMDENGNPVVAAEFAVGLVETLRKLTADNAALRAQVEELKAQRMAWIAESVRGAHVPKLLRERWQTEHEMNVLRDRATRAEAELAECKHELSSLRNTLDDLVAIQRERAEKAEAELAKVREASALLVGEEIARANKAVAERDEARGRCERLREVAKSATDRLVCDASCPARITGEEVDCTCGLVAVYDALDASLAECGEGE